MACLPKQFDRHDDVDQQHNGDPSLMSCIGLNMGNDKVKIKLLMTYAGRDADGVSMYMSRRLCN